MEAKSDMDMMKQEMLFIPEMEKEMRIGMNIMQRTDWSDGQMQKERVKNTSMTAEID